MYIIFINDLPKNGDNNYDYRLEGVTFMAEQNTICKITSILKEKEIMVTFDYSIRW